MRLLVLIWSALQTSEIIAKLDEFGHDVGGRLALRRIDRTVAFDEQRDIALSCCHEWTRPTPQDLSRRRTRNHSAQIFRRSTPASAGQAQNT